MPKFSLEVNRKVAPLKTEEFHEITIIFIKNVKWVMGEKKVVILRENGFHFVDLLYIAKR